MSEKNSDLLKKSEISFVRRVVPRLVCTVTFCKNISERDSLFCIVHKTLNDSRPKPEGKSNLDKESCSECNEIFETEEKYIQANGKCYHLEHFKCSHCHVALLIGGKAFEGPNLEILCQEHALQTMEKNCSGCHDAISDGSYLEALDRYWHEDCLKCFVCHKDMKGLTLYGDEGVGNIYCEKDYMLMFEEEKCAACGMSLEGNVLKALDVKFHSDCFRCAECNSTLGSTFFVNNDNVYCKEDFEILFAAKCNGCGEPVSGKCMKDKWYHIDCFKCSHCKKALQNEKFFQHEEDLYCLDDYNELTLSKCSSCDKFLTGSVLQSRGKEWHKHCFVCSVCSKDLDEGFLEEKGKLYCQDDFKQMFDLVCAACDEVLDGPYVEVLDLQWHRECFLCTVCLEPIDASSCFVRDNMVYCEKDFRELVEKEPENSKEDTIDSVNASHSRKNSDVSKSKRERNLSFPSEIEKIDNRASEASEGFNQVNDDVELKIPPTITDHSKDEKMPQNDTYIESVEVDEAEESIEKESTNEDISSFQGSHDLPSLLSRGILNAIQNKKKIFRTDYSSTTTYKIVYNDLKYKFQDYSPSIFDAIRLQYGIDGKSFVQSLCSPNSLKIGGDGGGRSGAFFLFSKDKRFVLKTMTNTEMKFLIKIFPRYYKHLLQNQHTMLPRFYGMYRVRVPGELDLRFIVMNNVFQTPLMIHEKYDLKGVEVHRYVEKDKLESSGGVMKDLNFKGKLYVGEKQKRALMKQLTLDCEFLKNENVMDHSMLLGIHRPEKREANQKIKFINEKMLSYPLFSHPSGQKNVLITLFQLNEGGLRGFEENEPKRSEEIYYFGILDILQEFNMRKKMESMYKYIKYNKKKFSTVESRKYNDRFVSFLNSIIA